MGGFGCEMASIEPILELQTGNVAEIAGVSREKNGVMSKGDSSDLEVLGADSYSLCHKLLELQHGFFIPREDGPAGMRFHGAHEPGAGLYLVARFRATANLCKPSPQLLLDTYRSDDRFLSRGRQSPEEPLPHGGMHFQFAQMICIEHNHDSGSPPTFSPCCPATECAAGHLIVGQDSYCRSPVPLDWLQPEQLVAQRLELSLQRGKTGFHRRGGSGGFAHGEST
jgi:hypothetical protein